jgi:hypothetical protein
MLSEPLHPLRRSQHLVIQMVGDDTLIYDEGTHRAVCLNRMSSAIWSRCDGQHSAADMANALTRELETPVSQSIVLLALEELRANHLIEAAGAPATPAAPGATRRDLIIQLGTSAGLLIPIISAITVPKASAQMISGGGGCVLADSLIQLADGTEKPAAQVMAGDWLRGYDPRTRTLSVGRVRSARPLPARKFQTLFTESGECLQASPSHLLLDGPADRHGKPLEQFRIGDRLLVFSRAENRVVSSRLRAVSAIEVPQTVFGFEMDTREHTYLADGVVSHNFDNK